MNLSIDSGEIWLVLYLYILCIDSSKMLHTHVSCIKWGFSLLCIILVLSGYYFDKLRANNKKNNDLAHTYDTDAYVRICMYI